MVRRLVPQTELVRAHSNAKGTAMGLILLIVIIILLVGGLPTWPYSREWGYGPSGTLSVLLLILLVLVLLGHVPYRF